MATSSSNFLDRNDKKPAVKAVFNRYNDSIYYPLLDLQLQNNSIIYKPVYIQNTSCGYCKLKDKSNEVFMQCYSMDIKTYEILINKSFRRSGQCLYKFDPIRNCCKLYTIRTNLLLVQISNDFKKSLKKYIKFFNPLFRNYQINKKNNLEFFSIFLEFYKHKSTKIKSVFTPPFFSLEKFMLYKKYQINIHKDPSSKVTHESFKNFLCENPFNIDYGSSFYKQQLDLLNRYWYKFDLNDLQISKLKPPFSKILGPLHECYYYEDKLVAISFIDVLINGISSVYFIYDTDFKQLSFGNLSALKDILLCQVLNKEHYYLGYYIANCPKMNYKKKFGGELLNIIDEKYYPIDYFEESIDILNSPSDEVPMQNLVLLSNDSNIGQFEDLYDDTELSHFELDTDIKRSQALMINPKSYSIKKTDKNSKNFVNVSEKLYNSFSDIGSAFKGIEPIQLVFEKNHQLRFNITLKEFKTIYNPNFMASEEDYDGEEMIQNYVDDDDDDLDLSQYQRFQRSPYYKRLPLVSPGLIPLTQMLKMIDSGDLDYVGLRIATVQTLTSFAKIKFRDIPASKNVFKIVMIDLIRLFGLEVANRTTLLL